MKKALKVIGKVFNVIAIGVLNVCLLVTVALGGCIVLAKMMEVLIAEKGVNPWEYTVIPLMIAVGILYGLILIVIHMPFTITMKKIDKEKKEKE